MMSRLAKRMKPCFTFGKFGDCKRPDCRFLHAGGVLQDGVWVKAKMVERKLETASETVTEIHPDDDAQTAQWRSMPMSKLRQVNTCPPSMRCVL